MRLPYSSAQAGERAMSEIQNVLRRFGCDSFGSMMDFEHGHLMVQFKYRGMPVSVKASLDGYAAAWLKERPWNSRRRCSRVDYELEAKRIAGVAVYSMLRDWIKGQVVAVETGILSFEGAFLGQILLPTGKTVLETAQATKMLPAPNGDRR
jgi:hypothetical protein